MHPPLEEIACTCLSEGQPFVLATILTRQGSVPRTVGAKMVVTRDGGIHGTIGGGQMEARTIHAANDLFFGGQARLLRFNLDSEAFKSGDMICGGNIDIFLDLITPTGTNIEVFDRWRRALGSSQKCFFATVVHGDMHKITGVDHCVLLPDETPVGNLPESVPPVEHLLAEANASAGITVIRRDRMTVILEPSAGPRTVYIFGAGHVAQAVARLASMLSFRVTVLDDRSAFANRQRFRHADEIHVIEDYGRAFVGLVIDQNDLIVILTRGHVHDKTVLAQALRTNAGYIGMIGSRRKRDIIYGALIDEGFCREDLDRVHSPIGLHIGAETPEEIAVSIVAELIQARSRML